jgi:hypothetical protein
LKNGFIFGTTIKHKCKHLQIIDQQLQDKKTSNDIANLILLRLYFLSDHKIIYSSYTGVNCRDYFGNYEDERIWNSTFVCLILSFSINQLILTQRHHQNYDVKTTFIEIVLVAIVDL